LQTDKSGRYAVQYKPYHLIGLELGISVASIMCRGEPTGQCQTFAADVVATAKRDLKAGEKLDGEGGFMVYGKLMPAANSLAIEGLPIGLAHGLTLKQNVKKDQGLSWRDVEWSLEAQVVAVRREMEEMYREEFDMGAKTANSVGNAH
jgi:predicted homoserine dehydrogenase-like protein